MRNVILFVMGSLLGTGAYGQGLHVTDDALDKQVLALNLDGPAMATIEMQQELRLDEAQASEVARMNKVRYNELVQAELSAADPVEWARLVREVQLKSDDALREVLTPQQLRQYLELEGRQNTHFMSENGK